MIVKEVYIDWNKIDKNSYLKRIPALKDEERISFSKPVTFFTGENGTGKSTLLSAMAINAGFNPEGGTKNYSFSTYQSDYPLVNAVRLARISAISWGYYLRAESFYNVATMEEEYAKLSISGSMNYHQRSHGESFLALVQNSFHQQGVYFLDEPEAALSPQRQLTLLMEIQQCVKEGSQFFIATHSPILLGFPDAEILSFDGGKIHPCEYEETDSYQITSMFINDRKRLLKNLFEEGE